MSFCSVLLARATDYWRDMLKDNTKEEIKQYNSLYDDDDDSQCTDKAADKAAKYPHIKKASDQQTIPACFFDTHKVDSSRAANDSPEPAGDWFFSVKEDGYLVILSRQGHNWSMQTRKGKELYPPEDFLKGLSESKELPDVMVGELITHENCWNENGFGDIENRAVKRNEQFSKLAKIWWMNTKQDYEKMASRNTLTNIEAWTGLRIKIFSFPQEINYNIGETYDHNIQIMKKSIHNHPWIGMCHMQRVPKHDLQFIIDIFTRVVQMGLEGIVLVDPDVSYADLKGKKGKKDQKAKYFFKLKPKHVLHVRAYTYVGQQQKDGKPEYIYQTEAEGQTVKFHDQMPNIRGNFSRIKYMEFALDVNNFQCRKGFRHMHFAQKDDMSMVVRAWTKGQDAADPVDKKADELVKEILLIGDTSRGCKTKDRVFNPRGYKMCEDEDFKMAMNGKRRALEKERASGGCQEEPACGGGEEERACEGGKEERVSGGAAEERACEGGQEERASGGAASKRPLKRSFAGIRTPDGRWQQGPNAPQHMRLNPYIVDVDYKKMDKLTQKLHESLRA